MFKKHQKVFYPRYGVGEILDITTSQSKGGNYLSYTLGFSASREKVSLPVSEASTLGLRALSFPKEIQETFLILSKNVSIDLEEPWKERKKEFERLFVEGKLKSLGFLVRTLFGRHQFRPLGTQEHQIYELSHEFLVDEIATVMDNSKASVEHQVTMSVLESFPELKERIF